MQQRPQSFVGIDISKDHLDACCRRQNRSYRRRFPNAPAGHRALIDWLGDDLIRACVEASGRYSLDVALALFETNNIEVMVANPRAVKNFREACGITGDPYASFKNRRSRRRCALGLRCTDAF